MSIKIVSGGQTGADWAGWRAARSLGLPTGGWMPAGFKTEDGPRPDFAREYGALEVAGGYRDRTHANARDSDATVWFGDRSTSGGVVTLRACWAMDRPVFLVQEDFTCASDLTTWLVAGYFEVVNVDGNRESTTPGIGNRVERFLLTALRSLAD